MAASTKPRRTKSARPDLMVTTNKELERQLMAEKSLDYSLSQRATSAHGNKRKSEGTGHVFPRQSRKDGDDDQLKTYYASQFEAKTVSADERQARPTSSTRRNNPHPQQEFMQWRLPVRVLDSRQGTLGPPSQELADTGQRFYQDYTTGNDGDAGNEVFTTIARSEFVGKQNPNATGVDTTTTVEFPGYPGSKCRSNTGKLAPLPTATISEPKRILPRPSSASGKRNVVGIAVQGKSTAKSLETWLEHTDVPSEEKDVVMTMLKSGATEDIRLKKALQSTLAEEAMPGVEEWVKSASDKDRKLVLQVFERLSDVQDAQKMEIHDESLPQLAPTVRRPPSARSMPRSRRASDPLPVSLSRSSYTASVPVPMLYRNTAAEKILKHNRTRRLGSRAGSRMRSMSANGDGAASLEETLDRLALDAGVDGTEARFSPLPSMHWHALSKREHTPNIVHRGSIFGGPRRQGSHWSICPEWQTA